MLNELDLQLQMDKHYELCSFDVEYLEEPVKPVIHNIPKLLFFTEGTGKIKIYNKEFDIVPNTLLMIFPWEIVEITQVEKPLAMMKISYNSVFNNFILNSLNRYKKSKNNILSLIKKIPVVYFNKIEAKTIKNIFYEIKNEVGLESLSDFKPFFDIRKEENATKDEFDLSTVYITNKLTELIILIAKKNIRDEKCVNKKEEDETNIVKYIYAHLNEKLTLNKLSVIFFMSESSISKYLEEVTGFMFNDLLRHMRISKALNLLVYTDLNIEEIAHLVGFVDGAHISNLCSKHLKMSPNKYREKYKDMYQIFNEKEQQLVSDVIKYIYENYTKELTINDVTEKFNITDTKLNKILMSYSGKRFIEFLNALKIDKACEMLLTTDKSVIDISFELGFNTVKTFNNNFSKLKNMSPTDFRKTVKHGS
ncbi:transcriptional regulator, AraC family [Leptotrichia sp. oral taxon 215 str. W9775]|jgi:putative helix-turn-helix domain-containing protein|uniref:helix-turn-helix domain-containing protein n=1 Tax=Leptotrichia sp. oral taxon 215 TaxID=712359 RepID=UPI0003ADEBD6|nr:AraC family transcriptional regulator [Leptotrichia sp. oral taxon 215]ERK65899.1 transcriptional regulator, AraC family [Leptotrichia sp. oral taxon 215 str. W9775]